MTQTNSQIREEIEEEFIEILEYGKNLKVEEVWTDLEKMQWLRKKIDELLKSQREEMIEKIEKMIKIVNYQLGGFFIEEESYNEAIKDILSLIKNN